MYPSGTGEGGLGSGESGVRLWGWGEGSEEEGEDRLEVGLGVLFMGGQGKAEPLIWTWTGLDGCTGGGAWPGEGVERAGLLSSSG